MLRTEIVSATPDGWTVSRFRLVPELILVLHIVARAPQVALGTFKDPKKLQPLWPDTLVTRSPPSNTLVTLRGLPVVTTITETKCALLFNPCSRSCALHLLAVSRKTLPMAQRNSLA